ncbi:hypothetical protein LSAT2_008135 [Lamellibrachia satsuma]|nr:hypothetical protein LSAT2_008135 [Lamellibrachia satsuma]
MVVMAATEREDKLSHGQLTQQDNRMSTLSVQLSVKCPSSWAFFHKDMPRSGRARNCFALATLAPTSQITLRVRFRNRHSSLDER